MPAVNEIPLDAYRTAIDGAKRQPRARSAESEVAALEATESVVTENVAEAPEGEAPAHEDEPQGRDRVLRLLSNAVRAALASQDVEAADAANDAISRLCGRREVG